MRLSKRRLEREKGRREATADMSEDLSEGEKGDAVGDLSAHGDSTRGRVPRINSVDAFDALASQHKDKKMYIVLIRHGPKLLVIIIVFSIFYWESVGWGILFSPPIQASSHAYQLHDCPVDILPNKKNRLVICRF